MKLLQRPRLLFQLLTFLSMLLVLGSLGAWETGSITLFQFVLQAAAFSALGGLCARLSSFIRPRRRRSCARCAAPAAGHRRPLSTRPAHAA